MNCPYVFFVRLYVYVYIQKYINIYTKLYIYIYIYILRKNRIFKLHLKLSTFGHAPFFGLWRTPTHHGHHEGMTFYADIRMPKKIHRYTFNHITDSIKSVFSSKDTEYTNTPVSTNCKYLTGNRFILFFVTARLLYQPYLSSQLVSSKKTLPSDHTVDGWEIRFTTTVWMYKNPVNNGINYQPQLYRLVSRISSIWWYFIPFRLDSFGRAAVV